MKEQLPEEYWDELIAEYRKYLLSASATMVSQAETRLPATALDCKRVGYDAGWLASFRRSNVELVSSAITAVTENGIETENGESYDVDIIIWATGFHVTDTGVGLSHGVYGEDGTELSEKYKARGGAYGFLGVGLPEVSLLGSPADQVKKLTIAALAYRCQTTLPYSDRIQSRASGKARKGCISPWLILRIPLQDELGLYYR